MFELPSAKRVKRSKLFSSYSSSEDEDDANDDTSTTQDQSSNKQRPKSKSDSKVPGAEKRGGKTTASDDDDDDDGDAHEQGDSMKIDYGFEYEFVDKASAPTLPTTQSPPLPREIADETDTNLAAQEQTQPHEQSYEFNLFAPKAAASKNAGTAPQPTQPTPLLLERGSQKPLPPPKPTVTIRSRSPTQTLSSGSITHPRPLSHYFTPTGPETLAALRSSYAAAALSPAQLTHLSTTPWPGTHLPWRVVRIPGPRPKPAARTNPGGGGRGGEGKTRPRPSKKRRVLLRRRVAARAALVEQDKNDEAAEREKRTRRNREKKVKRKAREKAKKAAGEAGAAAEVGDVGGGDDNDDDDDEQQSG